MFETLFPVLNPEPWESSNNAVRFKAANIIHYVVKGLCPSMHLFHYADLRICCPRSGI